MKKQHLSKIEAVEFDQSKFNTEGALPSITSINSAVAELTPQTKKNPLNKAKKETVKGTQVISYMVRKDLLKKIKILAVNEEVSMSEVINRAVEKFFQ
jgi:hypothetical protein